MKFKRLTSAAGADFEPAFDLYGVSFPIHEQRLIESQRSIMTHPEYLFDLIYDDSGEWCGDMLYWETADFIYVDRKSTRLNSSHYQQTRMPSSA